MNELSSIAPPASGPGVSVCVGNCARPAALNLLISRVVRRRLARACALGPPRRCIVSLRHPTSQPAVNLGRVYCTFLSAFRFLSATYCDCTVVLMLLALSNFTFPFFQIFICACRFWYYVG